MASNLDFEKPIIELEQKIEELRRFTDESGVDLSDEVEKLESRLAQLSNSVYDNLSSWQRVQLARQPGRPTTLEYIEGMCKEFVELHGDRNFRDDPAIVGGIGLLEGRPVTIIGHQKGRDTKENIYRNFGSAHPEGYRKALRLMKQAEKFHRPVILFIDTAGAFPGMAAEERGQSEAIATNLRAMAGLKTPTVCVVTGEGGSGGALGLGVTDRIFALEYAWYSVIAPESAAAILWKDSTLAPRAAETMRITARDLLELGIADDLIPEPKGGAQKDKQATISVVRAKLVETLADLSELPIADLLQARYDKYRDMGIYTER
ncbi:acetyl-CoA carboxylase carboxyltransferase subunit alpha [Alicyclobacillus mengziensis]|uniref:Acetyl-coenzyme A carboxylase carboxyl transferase subunit alpha n=1 Tax=Alicyclobacillus mengziensis TaxID=2931921 RepID=A0A9X7Z707_9BACL|nr:acetyl-CoA carboxylase carboxyltransferase subunit alpha [Alicyclobacillus mengziensis]QSO46773.1 acetyl-CoA carboxylase carboxyltransferase subunit alpha [Alicyclobacillus mengziensis]